MEHLLVKNIFILIGTSILFLIFSCWITIFTNPLDEPQKLIGIFSALFLLYGIFLLLSSNKIPSFLCVVLTISIGTQLIFLFEPAYFNDFFRYLWNGRVISNGLNPFAFSPLEIAHHPQFGHIAQVWYWDQIIFPWMRAIYGPTIQLTLGLAGILREDSIFVLKFLFFLCNLGSIALGIKILKLLKMNVKNIVLLALNPLFLFETLSTAHTEAIIIFFLFLSFLLFLQKKYFFSGISFAALVSTKFFPIVLLPLFLKGILMTNHQTRKMQWKQVGIFLFGTTLGATILWLPFILGTDVASLYESFLQFDKEWIQSPGIFALVSNGVAIFMESKQSFFIAKTLGMIAVLVATAFSVLRIQKQEDIIQYSLLIFSVLLLFSSVIFSWYVLWLVAFLPFIKTPWWIITLSFTIPFQYLLFTFDPEKHMSIFIDNGEILWNQLLIWIPPLIVFLYFHFKSASSK